MPCVRFKKVSAPPHTTTIHNVPCEHRRAHLTFTRTSHPAEEKKACETAAATRALETNGFERARGRIRKKISTVDPVYDRIAWR